MRPSWWGAEEVQAMEEEGEWSPRKKRHLYLSTGEAVGYPQGWTQAPLQCMNLGRKTLGDRVENPKPNPYLLLRILQSVQHNLSKQTAHCRAPRT